DPQPPALDDRRQALRHGSLGELDRDGAERRQREVAQVPSPRGLGPAPERTLPLEPEEAGERAETERDVQPCGKRPPENRHAAARVGVQHITDACGTARRAAIPGRLLAVPLEERGERRDDVVVRVVPARPTAGWSPD